MQEYVVIWRNGL